MTVFVTVSSWEEITKDKYPNSIFNIESKIESGFASGPIEPPIKETYKITVKEIQKVADLETHLSQQSTGQKITLVKDQNNDYEVFKTTNIPSQFGELNVFFASGNNSYINFILYPYSEKESPANQDQAKLIFNQILSTFQFTE